MNPEQSNNEKNSSNDQLNAYQQIPNDEKTCDSKINFSNQLHQSIENRCSEPNKQKDTLNQNQFKNPVNTVINSSNNGSTLIDDGKNNDDQSKNIIIISDNDKKLDKEDFYNENKDFKNNFDNDNIEDKTKNGNNSNENNNVNNANNKNTNNGKIIKNQDQSSSRSKIPTSSQKIQKSTFIVGSNNRPESATDRKRLSKASSQVVYHHSQKQGDRSQVTSTQSTIQTKSNQKIPYSMTSPSDIKFKSNQNT